MNYKILFILIFGIFNFNLIFAQGDLFTCSFDSTVGANILFANKNFYDHSNSNLVLDSNVATSQDSNYNRVLKCNINSDTIGNIQTSYQPANSVCPNNGQDLLYLTDTTNARVGFKYLNTNLVPAFNQSFYTDKLCVNLPDQFSSMDLFVSDNTKYKNAGYTCLFKTSSLVNGVVSSCDSTFGSNKQYKYTIWAKLYENLNSLKCNSDCTSVLDNRVYSSCSQKVSTCKAIPTACDGSLLNSWVNLNNNTEVKCAAPWGELIRTNIFTNETIKVSDVNSTCSSILAKKYTVTLNNELVTMNVYVCGDKK